MSTPFIRTPEQIAALRAVAESWSATPYAAGGCVKGAGCSCQNLPSAVLRELGHVHPLPPERGSLGKAELLPTMQAWLDAHPDCFAPVAPADIVPGDVLLWHVGTGHLSLALDRGEILHIWQHRSAMICTRVGLSSCRLVGAWRPLVTTSDPLA